MKYFVLAMLVFATLTSAVFAGGKAIKEVDYCSVMESPEVDLIGFSSKYYKVDRVGGVTLRSNVRKWCIDGYVWYQSDNGDIAQAEHNNHGSRTLVECKNH